eukprot:98925_1
MFTNDLLICIVAAVSLLLLVGYSPFIIHYYRQYRSLQKNVIFSKRFAEIVSMEVQIACCKILIGVLIYILLLISFDDNYYPSVKAYTIAPELDALIGIDYMATLLLFYLWIWRFWLLHFSLHFSISALSNEWKCVLNPTHHDAQTDWYLTHRHTFGNTKYVRNRMIIPMCALQCVSVVIPQFITPYHNTLWWRIYYNFHLFVPFTVLVVIYSSTNKFADNFYITKEMQRVFICLTTAYSIVFILNILELAGNLSPHIKTICFCVQMNAIWCGQFLAIITAIYWVPKQVQPLIIAQHYQLKEVPIRPQSKVKVPVVERMISPSSGSQYNDYYENIDDMEYVEVLVLDKTHRKDSVKHNKIKLCDVLMHYEGFELFMQHLTKEFSVECMLSLVEMVQFQQSVYKCMKEFYGKHGGDTNRKQFEEFENYIKMKSPWFHSLRFPKDVPLSGIVCDARKDEMNMLDAIQRCKCKAYDIYKKYIDYDAMLQINLPFKIKKEMNSIMNNYDVWIAMDHVTLFDLLRLFDTSCDQMYTLMLSSYDRFCLTHNYNKLRDCVFLS